MLEEQATTLQLLHGDDLTQYPEEVRAYLLRKATLQKSRKRARESDDNKEEEDSDSASVQYSREASSTPSKHQKSIRRPKVVEPDLYYGKSQRELDEFVRVCKRTFDHDPHAFPSQRDRIT